MQSSAGGIFLQFYHAAVDIFGAQFKFYTFLIPTLPILINQHSSQVSVFCPLSPVLDRLLV
jgi:hypothetical protein